MKLFVAGCSFSDYTKVDKVYGEFLSEKLGVQYVHEGAGCGSNFRIWRVIVNHILNSNLTSKDLLVIQYTKLERNEFWSSRELQAPLEDRTVNLVEPYPAGGTLIRYKADAANWQYDPDEKLLFDLYERRFVGIDYSWDKYVVNHEMFQHFLASYNIPTIFLRSIYWEKNTRLIQQYADTSLYWHHTQINQEYCLAADDCGHLSLSGHRALSDKLYEHIKEKGMI